MPILIAYLIPAIKPSQYDRLVFEQCWFCVEPPFCLRSEYPASIGLLTGCAFLTRWICARKAIIHESIPEVPSSEVNRHTEARGSTEQTSNSELFEITQSHRLSNLAWRKNVKFQWQQIPGKLLAEVIRP